jgi:exosortase
MTPQVIQAGRPAKLSLLAICAAVIGCFAWAHWTPLADMAHRWARDPQYSHGYLVPAFALVLLWLRRGKLADAPLRPNLWVGGALLAAGLALRLWATYFFFVWPEQVSLIPCLLGLVLLAGGWRALSWAGPSVLFLFFMIPLPHRLEVALPGPLQNFATVSTTFLLQTLGFPAVADGNIVLLGEMPLNIAEACSGLRMLMIFFAMSTGLALVIRRPLWEKLVLVASSVPIALAVNVIRITATGILHETAGSEVAHAVFHDLAGWLMMPLALGFLWLELKLLTNLLLDPLPATRRPATTPRPATIAAPVATTEPAAPATPTTQAERRQARRQRRSAGDFNPLRSY